MSTTEASQGSRTFYTTIVVVTAGLSAFLYGYDGSLMATANLLMRDYFHLNSVQLGFMMTSGVIGAVFGPFVGSWLCDLVGREKTLMIATILLGIGSVMTSIPRTMGVFNAFRIVCGFGAGVGTVAIPMYIAEMAPAKIRGSLGMVYQLAIVVGSAAAPLVAYPIMKHWPDAVSWRYMFGSQLIIVPILFVLQLMLPPSPRWLAEKGRFEESLKVLTKVHGTSAAQSELFEIRESLKEEEGGWRELFVPGVRYALFIGCCLAFFNNWTGWSAMGGYITNLVEMAGVKVHSIAVLQFACTYVAMGVVTVISMFLVDRVGRRPLWNFGAALMAIITLVTGFVFHYQVHGWPVLLVLVLCTVPHGIALGGLPWLMMAELYPNRIRAKAMATTTTFLLLVIYTCGQFFPIFVDISDKHLGSPAGVFWLFTVIDIAALIFGLTIMPETRGRTLESIAASMKVEELAIEGGAAHVTPDAE